MLEFLPTILAGCDAEVVNVVARAFKKRGIDVRAGVTVTGHTPKKKGTAISIEGAEDLSVDMVVMSVGRRPRTEGLLGEGTGVVIDERGFVVADGYQRTANPKVFAVGDVVANTPQLAHVGFAEAIVAIKTILGEPRGPGRLRPRPVGHLLQPRGRLLRAHRGRGQGEGLRGRREEGPLRRQLAARRSSARPRASSRSSPRSAPTERRARSSASTWPDPG